MDNTELNTRAFNLIACIDRFDRECTAEEYTDTDTAWELLNDAAAVLSELIGYQRQQEIEFDDLTDDERAAAEGLDYTHLYRLGNSGDAVAQDGPESHILTEHYYVESGSGERLTEDMDRETAEAEARRLRQRLIGYMAGGNVDRLIMDYGTE